MDYTVHGILQARILEWVAFKGLFQGNLPKPGIEPTSPTLQAESLPAEPLGKPRQASISLINILLRDDHLPVSVLVTRDREITQLNNYSLLYQDSEVRQSPGGETWIEKALYRGQLFSNCRI